MCAKVQSEEKNVTLGFLKAGGGAVTGHLDLTLRENRSRLILVNQIKQIRFKP